MRLWHKDLIPVLPGKQLRGQWRECCAIAKGISEKGWPNHIIVNRIMDYPLDHFVTYSNLIFREMKSRGYKVDWECFSKYGARMRLFDRKENRHSEPYHPVPYVYLFDKWHNFRYFCQCYQNLSEKFDCGGISESEYSVIQKKYDDVFNEELKRRIEEMSE